MLDHHDSFDVTLGVRMHLMSLGATPDEIDHLQQLIHRAWANRAYITSFGSGWVRIWIRCTARQRYRKCSSAQLFAMAPFVSLPRSKLRSTQFVVYQIPKDATVQVGDPWQPLYKLKDLDLNQPHQ